MKKVLLSNIVVLTLSLTFGVGISSAAIAFTDASFENGGDTDMDAGDPYATANTSNTALSTYATNTWLHKNLNNGSEMAALESATGFKGYDGLTTPSGITGSQFITGTRGGAANRSFMQYIQDNSATSGQFTFSIDYWVHEINSEDSPDGTVDIQFEVFAFNDVSQVFYDPADGSLGQGLDAINGAGLLVNETTGWVTYDAVSAATGFSTLQLTMDLGTGYDYVGLAVSVTGGDSYNASNGEVASFDNVQVSPVPEPSTFALLAGCFGLTWVMLRRRG